MSPTKLVGGPSVRLPPCARGDAPVVTHAAFRDDIPLLLTQGCACLVRHHHEICALALPTQGCTPSIVPVVERMVPAPARAGMPPHQVSSRLVASSLPCAHRNEPTPPCSKAARKGHPLPGQGCTHRLLWADKVVTPFPAHARMYPACRTLAGRAPNIPCKRRDVPRSRKSSVFWMPHSLLPQGCTLRRQNQPGHRSPSPACAGMCPSPARRDGHSFSPLLLMQEWTHACV